MDGPFWVDTRPPFIAVDAAQITLTAGAKAMIPAANLPPLGSGYFNYVGKGVRINMLGKMSTGATPLNGTFSLYWGNGADANGTIIAQSANFALTANATNLTWFMQLFVRCRALGASGSLIAMGTLQANVGLIASTLMPVMIPNSSPVAVTVDLTQNFVLSPQLARSGSTAEVLTVQEFVWEALN